MLIYLTDRPKSNWELDKKTSRCRSAERPKRCRSVWQIQKMPICLTDPEAPKSWTRRCYRSGNQRLETRYYNYCFTENNLYNIVWLEADGMPRALLTEAAKKRGISSRSIRPKRRFNQLWYHVQIETFGYWFLYLYIEITRVLSMETKSVSAWF